MPGRLCSPQLAGHTIYMTQSNDTNDISAIVWADGTYTTNEGTFVGGSEDAEARVLLTEAIATLEA